MIILMEPEAFDALVQELERKPKDMSKLRKLLEMDSPFAEESECTTR